MDSRLQTILKQLLEAGEPVTSSELAVRLYVSSKTVRNDVKVLNEALAPLNARIESYRGKGYQLRAENITAVEVFLANEGEHGREDMPSSSDERVRYLMERLLFTSDYIKADDLADALFISRSTLQQELKTIRAILHKYDLALEQKPHYGIRVVGNEVQIRFCISEYIFNQTSNFTGSSEDWLQILPQEELTAIQQVTLAKLREHKTIISDVSLQNLITHIAIACKRIRENHAIEMIHAEMAELETKEKYRVAEEIVREIENELHVTFSKYETAYITMHLQGTKLANSAINSDDVTALIYDDVTAVVTEMLARIDQRLNLQLQDDENLLAELSLHLKPAINRYKYNMNIRNPMLEEIKAGYPLSFAAALIGKDVLAERLDVQIDENEVGYMALHIEAAQERKKRSQGRAPRCLIVCASGLGSAQLLKYKLHSTFGEKLQIAGTTEYHNLADQPLDNIDFIISTIPIQESLPVPVKTVSTILSDSDVTGIEKFVYEETFAVDQYLRKPFTYVQRDFASYQDVITFMCDELFAAGKVDASYRESVLERENFSPTSFGNLVAIPHPLEPQTDETFWSVLTLTKPVYWIDKPVQFVVLLNIARENQGNLKPMYNALLELFDDHTKVNSLLQCKTFEQLRHAISPGK
ncbi:BglG family transcription antiterminator [Salisediminibacterium halotolerans]|uniref:Lichenan operon transcriptional antiterminator n=1 Tax=Salisediminibacterium halotolerans TaxID=517425 RepID=A0A1H9W2N0_9BACI|nr:BglG family transcription antiterminator [Salisediminibacterium haloalkalitolerans]SES28200.1 lichenan operon transcriptional antiterminator [Salisediminibacterium haloalkalitolerans]